MERHFWIVVHCETVQKTLFNVHIASRAGADGVILINHTIDSSELIKCAKAVQSEGLSLRVGINLLGMTHSTVLSVVCEHNPLWSIQSDGSSNHHLPHLRKTLNHQGLWFGSVAFKYQKQPKDEQELVKKTRQASYQVDVVTTSGLQTGMPADPKKIQMMKLALGTRPLGLASGVSANNVHLYLPYVSYYLVNTSISDDYVTLNEAKCLQLGEMIHL